MEYAIWVENTHSNFGEHLFIPEKFVSEKEAGNALIELISHKAIEPLINAGIYFSIHP